MTVFRWRKYVLSNPTRTIRDWTPGRKAAAARAVAREKAAVPLFPDLARWQTTEERMSDVDKDSAAFRARLRGFQAQAWKRARRELRALPAITREGLARYWNQAGIPQEPSYLLGLLRQVRAGQSPWTWLRRLWLLRHGKPAPKDS